MSTLVADSLEYLARSERFLRTVAIGGIVMFVYLLFLGAVFASVAPGRGSVTSSFGDGASTMVWGVLTLSGVVAFVVLSGFYVRIAERVIAGDETPPGFANGRRLVVVGALYCGTFLAILAVALAAQVALFAMLTVSLTLLTVFFGVPFDDTALLALSSVFSVVTAVSVVYPQPAVWILLARFRVGDESSRSYPRFVASRGFVSELGSILLSRRYVSSWVALVVVSVLQGAATIGGIVYMRRSSRSNSCSG